MMVSSAVLGPGLSARDRRVDEVRGLLPAGPEQLARDIGRRRGVVDEDGRLDEPGQDAVGPVGDRAQVVVIADAGQDDLGTGRGLARGRRRRAAEARRPLRGLGRRAVVDGHLRGPWPEGGRPSGNP